MMLDESGSHVRLIRQYRFWEQPAIRKEPVKKHEKRDKEIPDVTETPKFTHNSVKQL